MNDLGGKRFLVFGVASDTSIAWAIARELGARGATVTLGYQKRFLSRVMQLVKEAPFIDGWHECDVSREDSVARFFEETQGDFDGVVHAVAYAPAEALGNPVIDTTEEDFGTALVVSSYSLIRIMRHATPRLNAGSSTVALTYLGADRVVPGYRIMGTAKAALESLVRELAASLGPMGRHRVNAISAGPIRTLAASGVPGFDNILDWMRMNTPLRENVTQEDVARTSAFLLGSDASAITGQTLYVDNGYSVMGAPPDMDHVRVTAPVGRPRAPL